MGASVPARPRPQTRPPRRPQFQRPPHPGVPDLAAPRSPLGSLLWVLERARRRLSGVGGGLQWGQRRSLGLSVGLTRRPALHPSTRASAHKHCKGGICPAGRQPRPVAFFTRSTAAACSSGLVNTCGPAGEAQVPLKQASYHPGGFTGWGSAHSRKKGVCPPAGLSFLPVSACLSILLCEPCICLPVFFQCSLELCPLCVLLFGCVCVSTFLGMPVSLCVSACAPVCVSMWGNSVCR